MSAVLQAQSLQPLRHQRKYLLMEAELREDSVAKYTDTECARASTTRAATAMIELCSSTVTPIQLATTMTYALQP
jgi:hypothetical protein